MDTPEGRERVEYPLVCCLQADERGLLSGDLNIVRSTAVDVVRVYRSSVERSERDRRMSVIHDVIDLYMKLNFPEQFEAIERSRAANIEEEKPDQSLVADTMDEMYERLMQMADMF